MKISDKGIMALIGHEGVVLSRYKDAVGVWTIGVGHTKAAGAPDPATYTGKMTMRDAFDLMRKDIVKYERGVLNAVKVPLAQHEFDALVSFHFNTGAIAKASLTKHLNAGNKAAAAKAFANWTKGGGRVLPALVKRRSDERAMFSRGVYPKPVATLYPATHDGRVQWSEGKQIDLVRELQVSAPSKPAVDPVATVPPAKPAETQQTGAGAKSLLLVLTAAGAALWAKWEAFTAWVAGWF